MLTSVVPPSCRSSKIHLRSPCSSSSESSPVARPVPQRWRPNCVASPRARIATCSHHHVVTPSGAGWLLVSIPGRSMCSPLLIISKGAPLPRGAAVDSRLMALPPTPSPHGPAFAIQCMSTWFTPSGAGWLLMSIPGRSMCSPPKHCCYKDVLSTLRSETFRTGWEGPWVRPRVLHSMTIYYP